MTSKLRTKKRTLDPEQYDQGQPVECAGVRGIVWSLGPDVSRTEDTRWVVCEDGVVRVLQLAKVRGELHAYRWSTHSWHTFVPSRYVPFTVGETVDVDQLALAA